MSDTMHEASIIDLTDEELVVLVGALHEHIKKIAEAKKNDEQLKDMRAEVKSYEDRHYNSRTRKLGRKLKAARKLCELRRVRFELPEEVTNGKI